MARLVLEDGAVYPGEAFGAVGRGLAVAAEVVFNTAMTGYQEALSDPSYAGQILVMTAPLIGNTGANRVDEESPKVQVAGFVVRELARTHSNFRADMDLARLLAENGVLGITGIDTRALTRRLRVAGVMRGLISDDAVATDQQLVQRARAAPDMNGQNLIPLVGCSSSQTWDETLGVWSPPRSAPASRRRFRVLALDCGAKRNILRNLADRGCDVSVVPHTVAPAEITRRFRDGEIDGLFVSNGPGDPAAVTQTINTLRQVLAQPAPIPTFGICLGHQLLALALGARTYKLKFGHRGSNQPVLNLQNGRVEITSQNHGFAVDPDSLRAVGGEATHRHLNDGTLAGFRLKDRPVFSVQYHPEASPGPHDSSYLFDAFIEMMGTRSPVAFAPAVGGAAGMSN
ncbi:MAG: glutamine-hydrolyzing carbamoyl-phosphate synthase small subunit [Phycisphaerae bacterium]|nr:glutamine-hydrolyzing carbamoyl-phosphate synthase small subunit [Phycisphaerae bacterium]